MNLKSEGYDYSVTRLKSYTSERGRILEQVKGLSSFMKYREIYTGPESMIDNAVQNVKELMRIIFNKNNLHIGIISDPEGVRSAISGSKDVINVLNDKPLEDPVIDLPVFNKNQAFLTSADIVYDSLGGNIFDTGLNYSGRLEVLKNYISSDYLFDKIRLKGGAYGAWVYFNSRSGFMTITSYRDPNVKKTYEAYYEIADHIENFSINEKSFTNIKIGAYAAFDPLLSPYSKGKKAKEDHFKGVTEESVEKTVSELLETTQQDIRETAPYLRKYLDNAYISAIGNSQKLNRDKDLFGELIEIK